MSTPDSGTIDTETPSLTNTNVQTPAGNEGSPNNDETEVKNAKVDEEPTGSDKQENNATSKDLPATEEGEIVTSGNGTCVIENQNTESALFENPAAADGPPLPEEPLPPLPNEQPPAATQEDDGWAPVWDETNQAFYFYNRFTGATQWDNPRVPEVAQPGPPGIPSTNSAVAPTESDPTSRPAGGYDPAIHGDYDPNAWYAQSAAVEEPAATRLDPAAVYAATGQFNRFTGRWQAAELNPENFNDENKSKRQMSAYFDVDAAANNHDGRSLKEERSGKKLSKAELKQFKEKRKQKKEEKRRAWLRD
ncbi:fa73824d-d7c5-444f-bf44-f78f8709654e [Sclerotinia trifoliorum]|uniref:Fa73824d-d7c5-444f-bf44-f78f8709654e n=1 Tax=Sclerotinia trifoliorum TaxID=28548 RepID=A0A8H2VS44_9HELO|nr:fa73824d-d7c5-444f-bf44-f78f8709654e [Sclerotinia trifoliorum]